MVATTFSTDTPNLVADIVRRDGIAGNWCWWAFLLSGMMTVFLYARLWRRSGVMTDLEFYELRYSGKAAGAVRGFRSVYLGLFFNCFIMATVNLAAVKIAGVAFGWPPVPTLVICGTVCALFAVISGLWGVLIADLLQFGVAMTGSVMLAVFALRQPEVGGLSGLVAKVNQIHPSALNFLPDFGNAEVLLAVFLIPILIQWWSVWYPGAEPGGGSYIAQRMLAARSERDSLGGTLFFNVAHYALRPWPWILVALATLIVYPMDPPEKMEAAKAAIQQAGGVAHVDEATRMAARGLTSLRQAYPNMPEDKMGHDMAYPAMLKLLPVGFLGLMLAGLLSAYVSTIDTHLNWGTSYLVHDFYRRFLKPGMAEKHYVMVGRLVTVLLMVISGWLTLHLESSKKSFDIILSIGAGTGLIYLLRWFWWRVNAWCEITAMTVSFVTAVALSQMAAFQDVSSYMKLIWSVGLTTVAWLIAAFVTPPSSRQKLIEFYTLVRPVGPGWTTFRRETGLPSASDSLPMELLGWGVGTAMVWSGLFCTGAFLLGKTTLGWIQLAIFVASAVATIRIVRGLWASGPVERG
jgi:Na+/proline symporter